MPHVKSVPTLPKIEKKLTFKKIASVSKLGSAAKNSTELMMKFRISFGMKNKFSQIKSKKKSPQSELKLPL